MIPVGPDSRGRLRWASREPVELDQLADHDLYVGCRNERVVELGFGDPEGACVSGSTRDVGLARRVTGQVAGAIRDRRPLPDIPLELVGTEFDRLVWSAIREIPFGHTVSYSEFADRVGRPGAQRAVARACGRNRLAVLVPCHRVIGAGGTIGGYRWGVGLKRALIEAEALAV